MGVSSAALAEKADKTQTTKTPKSQSKKKDKSGVGMMRAGVEGGGLWKGSEGAPFPHLLRLQGGRASIASLARSIGSGEEGGEVRVWAVTHTGNP